ncbi:suppressor of fused domain protein [Stenotrophomonas sp. CFBP 13724]|uniref:suppressor of fused domain protein n=1 Tax=Stenotrophomonas sp. CFBP 13724 TaxID=2775298 RepID=UPI0017829585|nr:suppressor of fused domain protein [Stenotrophomonas sp. CFBP 13724]MBD8644539.1 suppressor of fused domain protein [Stenotrophomonas sp. CFBP 13724]
MNDDNGTPGWDAISQALCAAHPGQVPRHFGTALPWTLGGKDPLDGVSVYWSGQGRPHWHYVSYGLSELFDKESDDADVSGFGFELTFRLAAAEGSTEADSPPTWPMSLLQNLARYVFQTGNVLEAGHHLDANGPIAAGHTTALRHLAFVEDPQLPARDTPNGRLQFLQAVGLTDGEQGAILAWSTGGVLKALEPTMSLWITDLDRACALSDADVAARIAAGTQAQGAATGLLLVEMLEWQDAGDPGATTLVLGAGQVDRLRELLEVRLGAGLPLEIVGPQKRWKFEPGEQDRVHGDDLQRICVLSPGTCGRLQQALRPVAGVARISDMLSIDIRRSCLRDSEGKPLRFIG